MRRTTRILCVLALLAAMAAGPARALDTVEFSRGGKTHQAQGRMLLTAQDGGWLFQGRDGMLWAVPPDEQVRRTEDATPFAPLPNDEYIRQTLASLPRGFDVHQTAHYLIFHDTSKAYAQWCGSLFERLYMAFTNYWTRRGLKLSEPEFPLVAVVFADKRGYVAHAQPDLGEAADSMIGYYHLMNNRMTMYDLTGQQGQRAPGRTGAGPVSQFLAQPDAQRTVATIVHEATHQIAFNCGLHQRLSDSPLWLCEGIAMFFETPDLTSTKGWRGVGALNQSRVMQLKGYLGRRPIGSLKTLIVDDARFRDAAKSLDAYAEAWALTYFLINQYPKAFNGYIEAIAAKKPLLEDGPEKRLKEFEQHFGDLEKLDIEFLRYVRRW
jgi:hypothetical protein